MENTESLTDRMKRTQVWQRPGKEGEGPVQLVLDSAVKTLGLFTYKGDSIARHNLNEEPMLSPFSTSFFILGLFLTLFHIRRPYAAFLLIYWFVSLLPGILSVGAPNVPRVFGSLPPAIFFISFGILAAAQMFLSYSTIFARFFLVIILSGNLLTGVVDSMVRHPAILDSLSPKIAALWGMDRDQANVSRLINQLGEGCEVYLSPQFFFHSTLEYLTYSKSSYRLINPQTDLRKDSPKTKVLIIIVQPDEINPWWLRDDEGKRFYKWWQKIYQMDRLEIRRIVRRTYDPPFTRTSDWRLIRMIEENHPDAKMLRFENFSAYVLRPR